jgi:hypothetical protein
MMDRAAARPPMTEPEDLPKPAPKPPKSEPAHPFGVVPLVLIAVVIASGWYLIRSIGESSKMQDCIQSGRKNCAPLDPAWGR